MLDDSEEGSLAGRRDRPSAISRNIEESWQQHHHHGRRTKKTTNKEHSSLDELPSSTPPSRSSKVSHPNEGDGLLLPTKRKSGTTPERKQRAGPGRRTSDSTEEVTRSDEESEKHQEHDGSELPSPRPRSQWKV